MSECILFRLFLIKLICKNIIINSGMPNISSLNMFCSIFLFRVLNYFFREHINLYIFKRFVIYRSSIFLHNTLVQNTIHKIKV